jgi:hypothetical protein
MSALSALQKTRQKYAKCAKPIKIKEIGIQGVRPLKEEEKATYESRESAETFLANLTALPDKKEKSAVELRRYYCMWAKFDDLVKSKIC